MLNERGSSVAAARLSADKPALLETHTLMPMLRLEP